MSMKILGYIAAFILVVTMVVTAFAIGWQKGEKSVGDYYAKHRDLCFEGDILLRNGKWYSCPTQTTWVEEKCKPTANIDCTVSTWESH